jgi:hypothetical protein
VQEQGLGEDEQVDRDHGGGQSRGVDGEGPAGQPAKAGVAAGADAVFDAGVGAVAGVEEGVLASAGVGSQAGVAVAVAFLNGVEVARRGVGVPGGR